MTKGFYEGLQKYLYKSELEYRAKMLPCGSNVDWLVPYCDSVQNIAAFLRSLGFKIRRIVDEVDCSGWGHQWVVTTSGIVVYVNTEHSLGFVAATEGGKAKAGRERHRF